jgi:hypothetical protein
MDTLTTIHVLAQVQRELDAEVKEQNEITNMDILNRIKDVHGVIGRVEANVNKQLDAVFALEAKADELAVKATAPKVAALETLTSHLTEVVNALEGNLGPLVDGANQSTPSDGQSTENPPKA